MSNSTMPACSCNSTSEMRWSLPLANGSRMLPAKYELCPDSEYTWSYVGKTAPGAAPAMARPAQKVSREIHRPGPRRAGRCVVNMAFSPVLLGQLREKTDRFEIADCLGGDLLACAFWRCG